MQVHDVFDGRVVFDHLPKTAGQAVNAWLAKRLGRAVVSDNLIGEHRELIRRWGGVHSIVSGHIYFEPGDGLDPRYRYATLLREPLDRALSWIYYVLNDVPRTPATEELKDGAQRFVASDGEESTSEFFKSLSDPYVTHLLPLADPSRAAADPVAAALDSLQMYDVVGLYEFMPDFLADLSAEIGLPPSDGLPLVNATSRRPAISDENSRLLARIHALVERDMLLYRRVVECRPSLGGGGTDSGWSRPRPTWRPLEPSGPKTLRTTDLELVWAVPLQGYDITFGDVVEFEVEFRLNRFVSELEAGIHILDSDHRVVLGSNTTLQGATMRDLSPGVYRVRHHLIANLPISVLSAGFAFAERRGEQAVTLAWAERSCEFQVHRAPGNTSVGLACAHVYSVAYPVVTIPKRPAAEGRSDANSDAGSGATAPPVLATS